MARRRNQATRPVLSLRLPDPGSLSRSGGHLVTLVLVALTFWLLSSLVGQIMTSAQMDRRKAELQAEIRQLDAEQATLATAVSYAQSPAYAEKIAREQLGYAHDGDVVIYPTLPEATTTPIAPTTAALPTPVARPNWQSWAEALFP